MLATVNHLADLTGLDRRTVTRRLSSVPGVLEGDARKWDTREALPILYGAGPEDRLDPAQEKAQLDRARRLAVETESRVRNGELLEAAEVQALWVSHVGIAKGRLLALPSRLAPAVIGLGDLRTIEAVIREAIHEALTELSAAPDGNGD